MHKLREAVVVEVIEDTFFKNQDKASGYFAERKKEIQRKMVAGVKDSKILEKYRKELAKLSELSQTKDKYGFATFVLGKDSSDIRNYLIRKLHEEEYWLRVYDLPGSGDYIQERVDLTSSTFMLEDGSVDVPTVKLALESLNGNCEYANILVKIDDLKDEISRLESVTKFCDETIKLAQEKRGNKDEYIRLKNEYNEILESENKKSSIEKFFNKKIQENIDNVNSKLRHLFEKNDEDGKKFVDEINNTVRWASKNGIRADYVLPVPKNYGVNQPIVITRFSDEDFQTCIDCLNTLKSKAEVEIASKQQELDKCKNTPIPDHLKGANYSSYRHLLRYGFEREDYERLDSCLKMLLIVDHIDKGGKYSDISRFIGIDDETKEQISAYATSYFDPYIKSDDGKSSYKEQDLQNKQIDDIIAGMMEGKIDSNGMPLGNELEELQGKGMHSKGGFSNSIFLGVITGMLLMGLIVIGIALSVR